MKQLTAGVCTESVVVALWQGLKWEELGVKGDDLRDLLAREVRLISKTGFSNPEPVIFGLILRFLNPFFLVRFLLKKAYHVSKTGFKNSLLFRT